MQAMPPSLLFRDRQSPILGRHWTVVTSNKLAQRQREVVVQFAFCLKKSGSLVILNPLLAGEESPDSLQPLESLWILRALRSE
jgi:hypothetical protein